MPEVKGGRVAPPRRCSPRINPEYVNVGKAKQHRARRNIRGPLVTREFAAFAFRCLPNSITRSPFVANNMYYILIRRDAHVRINVFKVDSSSLCFCSTNRFRSTNSYKPIRRNSFINKLLHARQVDSYLAQH